MDVEQWLALPPLAVYLVVGVVVGVESLGVPLPGEIVLVGAALLSSRPDLGISPVWVALSALIGAVVGDSIGYALGRRYGRTLLAWLSRRFPRHFGPAHLAMAERAFARWGMLTVVVGRFIAILRIFAGPLAGVLGMPYRRFLAANVLGGLLWTVGTTTAVYFLGIVAEQWLQRFSYLGLAVALVVGLLAARVVRRRLTAALAEDGDHPTGRPAAES
ncbi:DedA family protein [Actinomycetospora corticicola]|uniref:Membrane protein DedA with SNARE-associated domain n=1 Tax=Actinomycetospora corticicola TaxID=663602 RepID=A0A7Y9DXT9_9PSEU|nr:membrane protein DedA with SNARE-associated domain [Actinomycetospora corticicola]